MDLGIGGKSAFVIGASKGLGRGLRALSDISTYGT
jgi:hypothetical protein